MKLNRLFVFLVGLVSARYWKASLNPTPLGAYADNGPTAPPPDAHASQGAPWSSLIQGMLRATHGAKELMVNSALKDATAASVQEGAGGEEGRGDCNQGSIGGGETGEKGEGERVTEGGESSPDVGEVITKLFGSINDVLREGIERSMREIEKQAQSIKEGAIVSAGKLSTAQEKVSAKTMAALQKHMEGLQQASFGFTSGVEDYATSMKRGVLDLVNSLQEESKRLAGQAGEGSPAKGVTIWGIKTFGGEPEAGGGAGGDEGQEGLLPPPDARKP